MPLCCRCNGSGRCKSCKLGRMCVDCLSLSKGHCENCNNLTTSTTSTTSITLVSNEQDCSILFPHNAEEILWIV